MKKRLSTLLKLFITIAALAIVLREVDLATIWQSLAQANWGWVAAGFALFNASLVVRAFRWWLLLRGAGGRTRRRRLVELYFVGNFFNIALPSGFGGDVVRVVEAARDVPGAVAAGTVILDRFTGLLMVFVMAVLILPWQTAVIPPALIWITVAGALGGIAIGAVLLEGNLLRRAGGWLPGPLSPRGDTPVARLLTAVQSCGWRAVGGALVVSVLFNLMLAGWWWTSGAALGINVDYRFYVFMMPLISVPQLIPSISGLGPRELVVPTLFASVGVAAETAVSLSLLVFAITRLSGLLGAPLYLVSLLRHGRAAPKTTESVESM